MKILVASSSPPDVGSGVNAACRNLCEGLIAQGHEVHFLGPAADSREWLDKYGVCALESDPTSPQIPQAQSLVRACRDAAYDGVLNNDNSLLQSVAPVLTCPFIAIGHMSSSSMATLACHEHQWTDYVVAISSDMQRVFTTRFGVPVSRCPVVPNGITDPLKGGKPRNYRSGKPLRAVFAGGGSRNKGAPAVLKALERLPGTAADLRIDWFGTVGERLRSVLRADTRVRVHGRVDRSVFHGTLAEADVFLHASRLEGCPMALLEAMAFGVVPITASGEGAMRWIVESGRNGYVCDPRVWDKQAADCLREIGSQPEALGEMKHAARETILQHYDSRFIAGRVTALLARPTVNRERPAGSVNVLRWHRPRLPGRDAAPLLDRICIRAGILRREGRLTVNA